ncbi:Nitrogen regulation protein NIFR3 [Staphylococcus aureus]|nr:Nitrogen regulation protein NIFR3 [Staphylococcus aureus]SBC74299.1 Nitrogen regulation protein NIFR3 [Staphylococcus aureus]
MLYWQEGPNIEKLEPQFKQAMQVGGAPTQKLTESQISIMCKLGMGPQHREFGKEIQQAMQVGDGAPT